MCSRYTLLAGVVLTAAAVGCSSDSVTGARGPQGETLTTVVSASRARYEDSIQLGVRIRNPTSQPLTLNFALYANVYAVFTQGSAVRGDTGIYAGQPYLVTITLQPGQDTTLSPTPVHFATPGIAEGFATGETFSLEAGQYKLK